MRKYSPTIIGLLIGWIIGCYWFDHPRMKAEAYKQGYTAGTDSVIKAETKYLEHVEYFVDSLKKAQNATN